MVLLSSYSKVADGKDIKGDQEIYVGQLPDKGQIVEVVKHPGFRGMLPQPADYMRKLTEMAKDLSQQELELAIAFLPGIEHDNNLVLKVNQNPKKGAYIQTRPYMYHSREHLGGRDMVSALYEDHFDPKGILPVLDHDFLPFEAGAKPERLDKMHVMHSFKESLFGFPDEEYYDKNAAHWAILDMTHVPYPGDVIGYRRFVELKVDNALMEKEQLLVAGNRAVSTTMSVIAHRGRPDYINTRTSPKHLSTCCLIPP
ncbi:MAG: hypothetical protein KJ709_06160 [Nanoarchaeota archaeon]|nr:hypothetical protein [Nanoarchaeota archaeon]